ncbi:ATP-binding protein [Streptosporangium canum]|uniref:ATP-binding protein n=1 Tax=Streptosporangium canum TaxID=324952 RepID=UPI0036A3791A
MSPYQQDHDGTADVVITRWARLRIAGHRDFPGVPQSAGEARRWVVELLAGHAAGEFMETLELLVSEVVTNAIVHSDSRKPGGLVTVCVGLGADLIHIEVIDDGSAVSVPAMRKADDDSLNGRGLGWVDLLADTWGSSHDDEIGGAVWFQLTCDGLPLP